ncbi:ABC transporter permease [Eubacterium sp.]|uniref:ABC transporter permease n=1 Tax=Eubacterium sp. TaxID=142586 RepID=UPI00258D46CF|nr:ABC transporter permease [Eubacterium sp.]MCR5368352.1 ABC transporter permease [Eubacterium sp.]
MKNKSSIYSLKGVDKVYKFTLAQVFKSKSYRISFIIFVIFLIAFGPINRLFMSSNDKMTNSTVNEKDVNISDLIILNHSDIGVDAGKLKFKKTGFKNINVVVDESGKSDNDVISSLDAKQVVMIINNETNENDMPVYKINLVTAKESEVTGSLLDSLGKYLTDRFDYIRFEASGLGDKELKYVSDGINEKLKYTEEEYIKESERKYTKDDVFALASSIGIIMLMTLSTASTNIVSSVMEEKTSKLVETLMISVRPLALVIGKILAMLTYVVLMLATAFAGSKVVNTLLDHYLGKPQGVAQSTFDFSVIFRLEFKNVFVLISSLILVFFAFAFIAGVSGGSCSKPEDVQSANGIFSILTMLGYFLVIIVPQMNNDTLNHALVYVPIVSGFIVPTLYVIKSVSLTELIIFYAINIIVTILLFFACAKVYRQLILIDGSKVKMSQLIKILFGKTSSKKDKEVKENV